MAHPNKPSQKIVSLLLSFLLICFTPSPLAFSQNPETSLTLDPTGQPVAVVSASEPQDPEFPGSVLEETSADLTGFVAQGPLSRSEEEEEQVLIESNDPFYNTSGSWGQSYRDMWWHVDVNAEEAWAYSRGLGTTVAVIDTGLDYLHSDISTNLWTNEAEKNGLPGFDDDGNGLIDDVNGWDFYNGDNDPWDDHGHGTHVSGIVGAVADNGIGIAGIAPLTKIIPIKVLSAAGSGFVSDVVSAIYYAADLAADVINMSLGIFKAYLPRSLKRALENAVKYAKNKGSVVVAAAGNNSGRVENLYPAGIKDVIAVGAIEPVTHNRAWFSNFGKVLDLVAPGVDVLSLRAGGTGFGASSVVDPDYSRASGTSMASPVVAGVAALLRGQNPNISYDQVVERLRSTAVDLGKRGFDIYYGWGLVDAFAALSAGALSSQTTTSSSSTKDASQKRRKKNRKNSSSSSKGSDSIFPPAPGLNQGPLGELRPFTHYEWRPWHNENEEDENKKPFLRWRWSPLRLPLARHRAS